MLTAYREKFLVVSKTPDAIFVDSGEYTIDNRRGTYVKGENMFKRE